MGIIARETGKVIAQVLARAIYTNHVLPVSKQRLGQLSHGQAPRASDKTALTLFCDEAQSFGMEAWRCN